MRRILIGILIGLYTFVLGVAATPLWLQLLGPSVIEEVSARSVQAATHDSNNNLPILAYCELANNPDYYSGQVVRVKTRLSGSSHGQLLFDPSCLRVDTRAAVFYDPGYQEDIQRDLKHARGSDDWREPLDIIAVGTFWKVNPSKESDTIYDTASLRFEIIHIEEAIKVR